MFGKNYVAGAKRTIFQRALNGELVCESRPKGLGRSIPPGLIICDSVAVKILICKKDAGDHGWNWLCKSFVSTEKRA